MKHKMRILSSRGDDETEWVDEDRESLAAAEAKFFEMRRKGYAAFADSEMTKDFNPNAKEILFVPAIRGG